MPNYIHQILSDIHLEIYNALVKKSNKDPEF